MSVFTALASTQLPTYGSSVYSIDTGQLSKEFFLFSHISSISEYYFVIHSFLFSLKIKLARKIFIQNLSLMNTVSELVKTSQQSLSPYGDLLT